MLTISPLTHMEAVALPSLSLAYLGDNVYEIMVREMLVRGGSASPSIEALSYVTASAQSASVEKILPHLTEDEEGVYRRGRNAVHSGFPKHATPSEYKRATGLEALFGYLYLTGGEKRLCELFEMMYPVT